MAKNAQTIGMSNDTYRRGVRRVLLVTLALNAVVVAGKLAAGLLAGSLSVISDAIHQAARERLAATATIVDVDGTNVPALLAAVREADALVVRLAVGRHRAPV